MIKDWFFKTTNFSINLEYPIIHSVWLCEQEYHSEGGYLTVTRYPEYPEGADIILKAAEELGYITMADPNGGNQTTFTLAQMTSRHGERLSTCKAFLYRPEVLARKNLNIIARAQVMLLVLIRLCCTDIQSHYAGCLNSIPPSQKPLSGKQNSRKIRLKDEW